jgi:sec-independent protein translocase protein TatA
MQLGPTELFLILIIIIVLFGVGRVGKIGGELGTAIANFRRGLEEGNKPKTDDASKTTTTEQK